MEIGIIGLPLSGKTTLFSTLTGQEITTGHVSGRIEIHKGVVKVPDERLDKLTEIYQPKKKTPATIEYIDVKGIEKEGSEGRGIDPQILQALKNTDALCVVVQAFRNEYYPHPEGSIDPVRDFRTLETEFLLSDLSIVENRIQRIEKQVQKIKEEKLLKELELMKKFLTWLESERPLREMELSESDQIMIKGYQFLTAKPMVVVINFGEEDIRREEEIIASFADVSNQPGVVVIGLCAKIEYEIAQLGEEDAQLFLEELGIREPAAHKLIRTSYELLGLISFFTVGETECRAWTIPAGTSAQKAAGVIHSDMERGFIRAEVVHYEDFMELGSMAKCREKGKLRLEGKDYIVRDGDIMVIRFNV